ncbi:hypothetical protein EX011_21785 [Salmonella enterica]|nr:hypothetical protein [Salmonella enterica]EAW2493041.1 hypothetical protein [Salmonella enterica subsp. enterica]HAV7961536.1 hypothetical protein [Escherichia coli]EBL7042156.1 hypothetical protein [Salmonella enterica]EHQ9605733.1 hypothetical protein [Salmonella enterica]
MEQKTPIVGYRSLSDAEIELINRLKIKGAELLALHDEVVKHVGDKANTLWANEQNAGVLARAKEGKIGEDEEYQAALKAHEQAQKDFEAIQRAEPFRWAAIGRTDIQTGMMALIRAVAQPDSPC